MNEIDIKALNINLDETNLGLWESLKRKSNRLIKKVYRKIFGYKKNIVKMDYPDVWLDADTRLLYSNMQILKEFVEEEMKIVSWEEETSNEIMSIYNWWKNYDNRKVEISTALSLWHDEFIRRDGIEPNTNENTDDKFIEMFNKPQTEKGNELLTRMNDLEKKLFEEEQDMLSRIIKIRALLWT